MKTIFFTIALVCASCVQYHPKKVETPEVTSWKNKEEVVATGPPCPEKWWEIFQDPQLNELEETAMRQSPTIQAAIAQLKNAQAVYGEVRADQFPSADLFMMAQRQRIAKSTAGQLGAVSAGQATSTSGSSNLSFTPKDLAAPPSPPCPPSPPTTGPVEPTASESVAPAAAGTAAAAVPSAAQTQIPLHFSFFQITPEISYEVDLWGKYWSASKSALMQAKGANEDLAATRLFLAANVAATYFQLCNYDANIDVTQKAIISRTHEVELNQKRAEFGVATNVELREAQVVLRGAESDLEDLKRSRNLTEDALAALVGMPASIFQVKTNGIIPKAPPIPAGLPSALLQKRPDIRRLEYLIESARLDVGVAKTAFFPAVMLYANAGFESNAIHSLFKWQNHVWQLTGTLLQNLYDAGKRSSAVKAAKAKYKQSVANFLQNVMTAYQEVEDALYSIEAAKKRHAIREKELFESDDLYKLSSLRFKNGVENYFIVITAEQTYLQSAQAANDDALQAVTATVQLIRALGGSWQDT